jgi:excisionase family DNA binding protein
LVQSASTPQLIVMVASSRHIPSLEVTKVHVPKSEENRKKPEENGNSPLHSGEEPGYNTPTLSFPPRKQRILPLPKAPTETLHRQGPLIRAAELFGRGFPIGKHFRGKGLAAMVADSREVMNIRQASQYLGVSPDTLYKYVYEEKIPAFKLGNRWKFKKTILDQWMEQKSTVGEGKSTKKKPRAARAAASGQ